MEQLVSHTETLLPVAMVVVIGAVVLVIVYYALRAQRRKMEEIARALGGEVAGSTFGSFIRIVNQGIEQRIEFKSGGKNSPPYIVFIQDTSPDLDLTITKEDPLTRLVDKLVHFDLKLGDPGFDNQYLITSHTKDQAMIFLMSSQRRELVNQFFQQGFRDVTIHKGKLTLSRPRNRARDTEPALLKSQLDNMLKFVAGN